MVTMQPRPVPAPQPCDEREDYVLRLRQDGWLPAQAQAFWEWFNFTGGTKH